jgi:hypothetical protein
MENGGLILGKLTATLEIIKMKSNIKNRTIIALIAISIVSTAFAETDSISILAEKCSYQFAPEYPDSLDIMFYSPFEWIREGIRFKADSKGNDLKGYVFLIDCYFDGKIKCIKFKGPNKKKCNKISEYLNTTAIKPWTKEISELYKPEPVKLLITWTKEDCIIERIINKNQLKQNESKLFIRKWNGFNF